MPSTPPPPPFDDPSVTDPLQCPPLRWGLIGCGRVCNDFVQALKHLPTAQVVACAARDAVRAAEFAEKHKINKSCKKNPSCIYFKKVNVLLTNKRSINYKLAIHWHTM